MRRPVRRAARGAAALALCALLAPHGPAAAGAKAAQSQPVDDDGASVAVPLAVEEIAPGVFVHAGAVALMSEANAGDIANIGFVVGAAAVAVIDTGGSLATGRGLLAAIRAQTPLPVAAVVNTHMHPDHVFGNAAFRGAAADGGDPVFIGHAHLPEALAARGEHYLEANRDALGRYAAGITIVSPDRTVAGATMLDLGGRTLRLVARPTAHTDNDLTVLDEATGTLFAGDLVFMDHLPVVDGSLLGWLAVIDTMKQARVSRIVPGHGPVAAPWPDALTPEAGYLTSLAEALRPLIAEGTEMGEAVEAVPPPAGWSLADAFHRRNVTAAFAELEWE